MMSYLILFAILAVLFWGVYRWRKLHNLQREARAQREAEFLIMMQSAKSAVGKPAAQGLQNATVPASSRTPSEAQSAVSPHASAGVRVSSPSGSEAQVGAGDSAASKGAGSLLGRSERLAYLLLKLSLPQHEVFAHVPLARVLDGHPGDFAVLVTLLVCDRSFMPVAAIDVDNTAESASLRALKQERLASRGVRYLRWESNQLPPRERVAEIVVGG